MYTYIYIQYKIPERRLVQRLRQDLTVNIDLFNMALRSHTTLVLNTTTQSPYMCGLRFGQRLP